MLPPGPDKDTFRPDRATGDPLEAHRSNFVHPVLYYYPAPPSEASMLLKDPSEPLPRPARLHHVLEDFLTSWKAQNSHLLPLRRFLDTVLSGDLRHFDAETCLLQALTNGEPAPQCSLGRLRGPDVARPPKEPTPPRASQPKHLAPPLGVPHEGGLPRPSPPRNTTGYSLWSRPVLLRQAVPPVQGATQVAF